MSNHAFTLKTRTSDGWPGRRRRPRMRTPIALHSNGSKLSSRNIRSRRVEPPEDGRPERAPDDLAAPSEGNADMANLTRRSVLRTSLALGAAGAFARPYVAKAEATTATVWWTQGSAQEEDISFKKIVAEYEKASGNTIDHSIMPYAPLRQKIVSAVTSGVVPDLYQDTPRELIGLQAWGGNPGAVSDVIETQKPQNAK